MKEVSRATTRSRLIGLIGGVLLLSLVSACGPVTSYDQVDSAWDKRVSANVREDLVAVAQGLERELNQEAAQYQRTPMALVWIGAREREYEAQSDGTKAIRVAYVFQWESACYLHGERDVVTMVRGANGRARIDDPHVSPLLLGIPGVPKIPCSSVSELKGGVRLR